MGGACRGWFFFFSTHLQTKLSPDVRQLLRNCGQKSITKGFTLRRWWSTVCVLTLWHLTCGDRGRFNVTCVRHREATLFHVFLCTTCFQQWAAWPQTMCRQSASSLSRVSRKSNWAWGFLGKDRRAFELVGARRDVNGTWFFFLFAPFLLQIDYTSPYWSKRSRA